MIPLDISYYYARFWMGVGRVAAVVGDTFAAAGVVWDSLSGGYEISSEKTP